MQIFAAAFVALVLTVSSAFAAETDSDTKIDELFSELQESEGSDARRIEGLIWGEWSKSGSAAMDLLLERGRKEIDAGDYVAAINHLTALTDHAPDFAEGWNSRATALFYASRYGEAVDDIAKALALNPRHFGAMSGLAFIYEAMDRPKQALAVMREVRKLNPHQEGIEETIRRLEKASGEELL